MYCMHPGECVGVFNPSCPPWEGTHEEEQSAHIHASSCQAAVKAPPTRGRVGTHDEDESALTRSLTSMSASVKEPSELVLRRDVWIDAGMVAHEWTGKWQVVQFGCGGGTGPKGGAGGSAETAVTTHSASGANSTAIIFANSRFKVRSRSAAQSQGSTVYPS